MESPLSKLQSWTFARKEQDIRGWPLKDGTGQVLGTVRELIVETDDKHVSSLVLSNGSRYAARDVVMGPRDLTLVSKAGERSTQMRPVAAVPPPVPPPKQTLETTGSNTARTIPAAAAATIAAAAAFPAAAAAAAKGRANASPPPTAPDVRKAVPDLRKMGATDEDDVVLPIIEEELVVSKRIVEDGGMQVRSHIVEKPVEQQIRLRAEHVKVDREKVDRPLSAAEAEARFVDSSTDIEAAEEIATVDKQAHVVEEIHLHKSQEERVRKVTGNVRHTETEIVEIPAKRTPVRPN